MQDTNDDKHLAYQEWLMHHPEITYEFGQGDPPPTPPHVMKWGSPDAEEFFQKLIWRDISPKPAPEGDTNKTDEGR